MRSDRYYPTTFCASLLPGGGVRLTCWLICAVRSGWLCGKAYIGRLLLYSAPDEPFRIFVHEVDVATFHTPAKEDAISVLHQFHELILRPLHYLVRRFLLV